MGRDSQTTVALLTDYNDNSAYSIAYHTAYINLRFSWDKSAAQTHAILLTTPANYSGRAEAAANIAIAAAQNGMPTILVDADLSGPGLQQRFGVSQNQGLTDLLTASADITPRQLTTVLSKTFVPQLSLLGTGAAGQSTLELSRQLTARFDELLTCLRQYLEENEKQSGLLIFTSPPVLSSIDAALISSRVDQTFLLLATGKTTRTQAKQAQAQLKRAHATLTGVIMLNT